LHHVAAGCEEHLEDSAVGLFGTLGVDGATGDAVADGVGLVLGDVEVVGQTQDLLKAVELAFVAFDLGDVCAAVAPAFGQLLLTLPALLEVGANLVPALSL
jgi:hypothetical protein